MLAPKSQQAVYSLPSRSLWDSSENLGKSTYEAVTIIYYFSGSFDGEQEVYQNNTVLTVPTYTANIDHEVNIDNNSINETSEVPAETIDSNDPDSQNDIP